MAFTVTNSVAPFRGQNHLTRTNNTSPKALERPAPDVKIKDNSKEQPAPDVKINFSAKGLEAALERPAPDAKSNPRAQEPAVQIIANKQQTRIELQTAINDTKKAVKQVKAGDGALKEINDILLKVRDRVLDVAKNGGKDEGKRATNQKEIANALKALDRIASSAQRALKTASDKSAGKVDSPPNKDVKALPPNPGPKTSAAEVKTATAPKTGPTPTSKTPVEVKVLPTVPDTKAEAGKVKAPKTAPVNKTPTKQAAASNTPGQTNEVVVTDATSQAARLVPLPSSVASQVAKQAPSRKIDFGQAVLDYRDIIDNGDKLEQQPAFGISNLLSTLATPAKGLEAQPTETVDATSTINHEELNEESEEKDVETKKFSLLFQGGTSADQIAKLILDQVRADTLEEGAEDLLSKLSTINVSDQASAQKSLQVIEQAIRDTASLRTELGAFQTNTLANNAHNLRANLENRVTGEATIRDTDFATAIANFTGSQVQLQAGSTVLGNANQVPQLVADLLRG